ncbi:hypothetical protein Vadar_010604 [Vaccinium darrowii]|uniref:Uncharacterized protein n=1 Tax=Vaccinium darrowii TaxID=229202 RepID=A0ACB7Y6B9_9ERIC|nr:hypothetical protein Vadar_010604 [Vaccinium darrowii]
MLFGQDTAMIYGVTLVEGGSCKIKIVVGAALAHEMMHAWIRLHGWTFTLEKSVEESICDVVASMWLDYTADENDPSYTENNARFAKSLSRHLKNSIETGSSGGEEFLKAKHAVEKYGLEDTLMLVVITRSIPE